jgi:hypothetical protein
MHVNRGLLGWGVLFIALGAVPLAVRGGALDTATARRAWELWPLILIGAGLGLALRNTPAAALGNVVVGLAFGLMGGGLIVGGLGSAPVAFCGTAGNTDVQTQGHQASGTLAGGASVDLSLDCGSLTLAAQPGTGWSIAWPADSSRAPQFNTSSTGRLHVELGAQRGIGIGDPAAHWDMQLPADPTLDLSLSVNAGSAKVALGGAHLSSLSASVNAGDAKIDLTGASGPTSVTGSANAGTLSIALPEPNATLTGSLSANAGSVRICVPSGTPLRIRVGDEPLGSNNLAQRGLTQNGGVWTRGSWDTAVSRIDLTVSANLGSITLDPDDGCG